MGGRHPSERLVVINWNDWSRSIGIAGRHQPVRAIHACDDAAQSPAATPSDVTRIRERRLALVPIGMSINIPSIPTDVWPIVARFLGTTVPNMTAWAMLLFGMVAAGKGIVRLNVLPIDKVRFVLVLLWIEWATAMISGTSLDKPRIGDVVLITGFLLLVANALPRPESTTLEDRSGEWTTG
jgi:hypothetical protein